MTGTDIELQDDFPGKLVTILIYNTAIIYQVSGILFQLHMIQSEET